MKLRVSDFNKGTALTDKEEPMSATVTFDMVRGETCLGRGQTAVVIV